MLTSFVLELGRPRVLFTSHHALSWMLSLVRERDPELSAALHQPNSSRPFTVWAGSYSELGGAIEPAHPQAEWLIRVTSLSAPLSRMLDDLSACPPRSAAVGKGFVPVLAATTDARCHPLASRTTAAAVVDDARQGPPDRRVSLHFLTPTAFGRKPKQLFPLPDRVFGSVLHAWNEHVRSHAVPLDTSAQLERGLQVEAHHLATREPVALAGFAEKGFVGWCEYSVPREAPTEVVRALHLLAKAAFFTGVGGRTSMGMGQTIPEAVARPAKPRDVGMTA